MMKRIIVNNLYNLMDRFEEELNGLYEDLREMSSNRKYNFIEAEVIKTADSYLDFVIERLSGFILRPETPKEISDRAEFLLEKANEIRDFIYRNFSDVYRRTYDVA